MKMTLILISIMALAACGKTKRQKAAPEPVAPKSTPSSLDQWSGRSDFTDSTWLIKSQP